MLNLFTLAKANAARVQSVFDALISNLPDRQAAIVREFAHWVESAAIVSINVKLLVVVELLAGRNYRNIYEWAEEMASLCGRTRQEILRERLGSFYDRRVAFDSAFERGAEFRYGA